MAPDSWDVCSCCGGYCRRGKRNGAVPSPLGNRACVLAITLLIALAIKGSTRRQTQEPAAAQARTGGHRMLLEKMRGRRSLAAELALLAELHAKGALSDEEFSAAKLRTLAD